MLDRSRGGFTLAAVGTLAVIVHGCALVHSRYQPVTISTNVPAKIFIDNISVGSTRAGAPLVTKVRRSRSHSVTAEANGYEPQTASLQAELNALGVLDVIGGMLILLPFITLLTGQAFEVEPDHVQLDLKRETRS